MAALEVNFPENILDKNLAFAVIITRHEGKWVFCKHKERDTFEIPGGRREAGESILHCARRELYEETGAVDFVISPVCVYSVKANTRVNISEDTVSYGMVYFAEVKSFEAELHSEIERIIITDTLPDNWTYPLIQPKLIEEAARRGVI